MTAGIILIIVGVLGLIIFISVNKSNLNLIAGYNTLSDEKKDEID